jgi:hypothetical protein
MLVVPPAWEDEVYWPSCTPWQSGSPHCGSLFGGLNEPVDTFNQPIRHLAVKPTEDSLFMLLDRLGYTHHRL